MGTFYGYSSKASLVEELLDPRSYNGATPIAHALVGSTLYVALQDCPGTDVAQTNPRPRPRTAIAVYLLKAPTKAYPGDWGYKPLDESMGPYVTTCPPRLLRLSTIDTPTAVEWRAACAAHHARKVAPAPAPGWYAFTPHPDNIKKGEAFFQSEWCRMHATPLGDHPHCFYWNGKQWKTRLYRIRGAGKNQPYRWGCAISPVPLK